MRAAVEEELIGRSPCVGVKLPAVERAVARVVTPGELHRLPAALPEPYRTMPYPGAVLGLRISEVLGRRVASLHLLSRQRRTMATAMAGRGVGMRDAMELFGHSDARLMLEIYAKPR